MGSTPDAITAGADEDLLIGGTTDFDTDAVAMQAIAQAIRSGARCALLLGGRALREAFSGGDVVIRDERVKADV